MTVETQHPQYTSLRSNEWDLMLAANDGESAIKEKGETYLPKPSGFKGMPDGGNAFYGAYKTRAQFPDILAPTVSAMVGIIHGKKIEITLPDSMDYVKESATKDKLSLEAFHRRITSNLLKFGRYCVLADAPEKGGEPYLCGYSGRSVINWDDDNSFYVINDSGMVRDGYEWKDEERFLTLQVNEGRYELTITINGQDEIIQPSSVGGQIIDRIPFVVGNALDISPELVTPPLIGVARAALAIYQLSADYRWQLFMSGQETLVAINGEAPSQVGAGVAHSMIGSEGVTPDLKYVGPSCIGIEAHKTAMDDNKHAAILSGAKLLEQDNQGVNESGKARSLRFSSETATLSTIAGVSCEVLETSLRNVAMMKGLSEDQQNEITVRPPGSLMDTTMSAQDAKALVESWQAGGFSTRTLYENLQRGGIANPERTFEDELAEPEGFGDENIQLETRDDLGAV